MQGWFEKAMSELGVFVCFEFEAFAQALKGFPSADVIDQKFRQAPSFKPVERI